MGIVEKYECTVCGDDKPASEYYFIQSGRRKGLRKSKCKQCLIDESRVYKRIRRFKEKTKGKEIKELSRYMIPTF